MKRIRVFREIKRVISQFIETEYWYRFKRYYDLVLDSETGKYKKSYWRGYHILNNTWDGDGVILALMRMKVHHMYHNLKHYGMHKYNYINIIPAPKMDFDEASKKFILERAIKSFFEDDDELFLGIREDCTPDVKGYSRYYLTCDKKREKDQFRLKREVCVYNGKIKTRKYSCLDENGKFVDKTEDIHLVDIAYTDFGTYINIEKDIRQLFDYCLKNISDFNEDNLFDAICWKVQTLDILPSEMKDLPEQLKSHVHGMCEDLKTLLAFYKRIKKVDCLDWSLDEENYFKQKTELLEDLGNFMAKNGHKWSD